MVSNPQKTVPAESPVYIYRDSVELPERKGAECRILEFGANDSCLIEFTDGFQTRCSRVILRRKK